MRMHIKIYLVLICISFWIKCGKEEAPPPILEPGIVELNFPNNNEACLQSTSIGDTQANVNFRWTAALNVEMYELVVTNILTNEEFVFESQTLEKSATLIKQEPYRWKVRSIGMEGSTPRESDLWQFYLAGDPDVNYSPFPPELLQPISGSRVTPSNETIELRWNCSDVDGDLARYEVYLDNVDASTLINTVDALTIATSLEVTVENDQIFYWKVKAFDQNGNTTTSEIYSFRTN